MKRALGIDYGDARIGLALSDEVGFMAHPLETIHLKKVEPIARIAEVISKHDVETLVIGLPRNMDGSYGPSAEKVRTFADRLRARVANPIVLWDERMTTLEAQRDLHAAGRDTRSSREVIDQAAAQKILQSWMDSQPGLSTL